MLHSAYPSELVSALVYLVFQTRADIRVRVRSIVIRIRIRHTAIRVRIVVPAIDHTAYREALPGYKVTEYMPKFCINAKLATKYVQQ